MLRRESKPSVFGTVPRWSAILLVAIFAASCRPFSGEDYSLVDAVEPDAEPSPSGRYPDFVEASSATGSVNIGGDTRESLTPPFPSRRRFDVEVPSAAFLDFSTALVMVQDVRRARVEFRVLVGEGTEEVVAYSEILRADVANQWQDREVDLSPWSGRAISLTVETRAVPPRVQPLWADRVQTVWGNPVLGSRPGKALVTSVGTIALESSQWLGTQLEASGLPPDQQAVTWMFGLNLFLGGILSMAIRELYKRFAKTLANRESFANMLPLFTLASITVISVVQYSPALALGLVGALSVVRFRAAITSAEELVYLLMCVGLGVAIGANHVHLAVAAVILLAPFVVWRGVGAQMDDRLILTVAAEPAGFFDADRGSVIDVVRRITSEMVVERLDREAERILLRVRISVRSGNDLIALVAALRTRVAECRVSSESDAS
ncbi:MAG: DUF4956 domain-containing protein [Vicinamibacteria bacterium]